MPSAKPVADALDELFLGFVRRVLLARKNHDVLAVGDDGVRLLVRLQACSDAASADEWQCRRDADEAQASHAIPVARDGNSTAADSPTAAWGPTMTGAA